MKVFVTGGTGVLGQPVLKLLAERGHDVVVLAHSASSAERLLDAGVAVVEGQLIDAEAMVRATDGFDGILHLATRIPASAEMANPSAWDENDTIRREGTRNLVDAALANGVEAFVYPSVTFVYPASGDRWIDASTADIVSADPVGSSLIAEMEVERFTAAGRRGVTLRLGQLYGPTSIHTHEALQAAQQGVNVYVGDPDAFQSPIWMDDAASALVAALEQAPAGTYDVVDDEPLRLRDVVGALAAAVGRAELQDLAMDGAAEGTLVTQSRRVSNRRFKEATGWQPTVRSARDGWQALSIR